MADIRIEKKRPLWPWLILILILGILAFLYIYGSMDTEEVDDMEETEMEKVTSIIPQTELPQHRVEVI